MILFLASFYSSSHDRTALSFYHAFLSTYLAQFLIFLVPRYLLGANQYRSFDLNEEYNSWVLLARQAVVDVMFLDSNQLECQLKLHRATHNSTTITTGEFYGEFICVFFGFCTTAECCCVWNEGKFHPSDSFFHTHLSVILGSDHCFTFYFVRRVFYVVLFFFFFFFIRSFGEFCAAADSGADGSL